MSTIINNLNWRYATKKFDASKKISNEDLNQIKTIISNRNIQKHLPWMQVLYLLKKLQ